MLTFAVALISGGRLRDIVARRRRFRAGLIGVTLAPAMCAAAPSPEIAVRSAVIMTANSSAAATA